MLTLGGRAAPLEPHHLPWAPSSSTILAGGGGLFWRKQSGPLRGERAGAEFPYSSLFLGTHPDSQPWWRSLVTLAHQPSGKMRSGNTFTDLGAASWGLGSPCWADEETEAQLGASTPSSLQGRLGVRPWIHLISGTLQGLSTESNLHSQLNPAFINPKMAGKVRSHEIPTPLPRTKHVPGSG